MAIRTASRWTPEEDNLVRLGITPEHRTSQAAYCRRCYLKKVDAAEPVQQEIPLIIEDKDHNIVDTNSNTLYKLTRKHWTKDELKALMAGEIPQGRTPQACRQKKDKLIKGSGIPTKKKRTRRMKKDPASVPAPAIIPVQDKTKKDAIFQLIDAGYAPQLVADLMKMNADQILALIKVRDII